MKSFAHTFSLTVISLIVLTSLITFSVTLSKKAARYQANVIAQSEVAPQIPASSIAEMINSLTSGR